jgi:hypothetical protein
VCRFAKNIIPIPAQIMKIEVEFPIKRLLNVPKFVLFLKEPKQKIKFTTYIPKIA